MQLPTKSKNMKKIIASLLLFVFFLPQAVQAFHFNKNNIISDSDLTNHRTLSLSGIDSFLRTKGSGLVGMVFPAVDGDKTAAQIIYDAAQYYRISPKYLVVRIQLEQGLVTDSDLAQSQIDWATGYGCPDGYSCSEKYRGFFSQINESAKAMRGEKYLGGIEQRGATISGWGVGITKTTLDGIVVTPENKATACLYTYTPWVGKYGGGTPLWGGNSLLAKTWYEWFQKKYPDGTLVRQEGEPGIWLIQNGQRRPFHSRSAFYASHDPAKVINISSVELEVYPLGRPIKYADYSLIQSPGGTIYLIVDGQKRGIASMEVFRNIGFNPMEVIRTDWSDINAIPDGPDITMESVYPTGALLQSQETGGIFEVENGIKHPIWSKEILQNRFPNQKWTLVTEEELNLYPKGEPVKFQDGELVTSPGTNAVFVISNGERRKIASREVFESLGYHWENIIWTSDQALLKAHPLGQTIDLQ